MRLGINLSAPLYYNGARTFTNLLAGGAWRINNGKTERPAELNEHGTPLALAKGESALTGLSRPSPLFEGRSVPLAVTWAGKGVFSVIGDVADVKTVGNRMTFTAKPGKNGAHLQIRSIDADDPPRDIVVCEASLKSVPLFDPAFITSLRGYKILRFVKWQKTEDNLAMTLARRTTPDMPLRSTSAGYAQEHCIALCNQVGADGWFHVPWNADDAFVRDMAERCRDTMKGKTFVETSNEVWNNIYKVHKQALAEATAQWPNLDVLQKIMRRYAQRAGEIMDIWTEVFAGQMHRLVRVAAFQNGNVWGADKAFKFAGFADKIDMVACAPYIDMKLAAGQLTKLGGGDMAEGLKILFDRSIPAATDKALTGAGAMEAFAIERGKGFMTYEAGQHIMSATDVPQLEAVQRDRRMEGVYRDYLGRWKKQFPQRDIILFCDVGAPDKYGAWGLRDYTAQPLTEAPKARGVAPFLLTPLTASGPASLRSTKAR
jgi:hypothetical protein